MRIERNVTRYDRPCMPSQSHPVVRPDDRRRLPDGSAPRRAGWSKSGLPKGVYAAGARFRAMVRYAGALHHLGTFATADEAARAAEGFLEIMGERSDG